LLVFFFLFHLLTIPSGHSRFFSNNSNFISYSYTHPFQFFSYLSISHLGYFSNQGIINLSSIFPSYTLHFMVLSILKLYFMSCLHFFIEYLMVLLHLYLVHILGYFVYILLLLVIYFNSLVHLYIS